MAAFLNNPLIFFLNCSLLTLIVVSGGSTNSKSQSCPSDHYFDSSEGQCKKCSTCPANRITIRHCSQSADVRCGSYARKPVHDVKSGKSDYKFNSGLKSASTNSNNAAKKDANLGGSLNNNRGNSNAGSGSNGKKSPTNSVNSELNSGEDNYWKTLAFALIGLLSVLIITTFIILIFVYKKLQKSIVITQTEDADLMDDADSGYVIIRAIHHMATPRTTDNNHPILSLYPRDPAAVDGHHTHSPPPAPPPPPVLTRSSGPTSIDSGRPADSVSMSTPVSADDDNDDSKSCFLPKTYQPQRRLLNYDADDVFESDNDNASVKNHQHHPHHHHHSADLKQRLHALLDENESDS